MPVDVEERRAKAEKIIRTLRRAGSLDGKAVLEIGTGTGVIPSLLSGAVGESGSVDSVDVVDSRILTSGYKFHVVVGFLLPFDASRFDVVISNHVIEHVGNRAIQEQHLREIHRVLRPDGLAYVATPSRWAPVEPHFGVPLLSWPPRRFRTWLLRRSGRGTMYDVDPYGPMEIRRAFKRSGLDYEEQTLSAVRILAETESHKTVVQMVARLPDGLVERLGVVSPTMIFLIRPRRH
jgi:SAM-dependent methyltransferase